MTKYESIVAKYGEPNRFTKGGEEIQVTCPQCGNGCLSCNIISGLMHCFHCHWGKGQIVDGDSDGFEKIEPDMDLQNQVVKRVFEISTLDNLCRKYLKRRGIYNPEKYRLATIPYQISTLLRQDFTSEELIKTCLFEMRKGRLVAKGALDSGRIIIPYWNGKRILGLKSRAGPLDPTMYRYANTPGSIITRHPFFFGPLGKDVIVTEGELASLAASEAGLSVISIPGITMLDKVAKEIKQLVRQGDVNRVFINIDSDYDYENKWNIVNAAVRGSDLLGAHILFLPQPNKGKKMDLDSFLLQFGPQRVMELMEESYRDSVRNKVYWRQHLRTLKREYGYE